MATKTKTRKRFGDNAITPKPAKRGRPPATKAHPGEDGRPSPGEIARNRRKIWQLINAERARCGLQPVEPYDVNS